MTGENILYLLIYREENCGVGNYQICMQDTKYVFVISLVPKKGSCNGSFTAYKACIHREFGVCFCLQFGLHYFAADFQNVNLQLLSTSCTF
jgi:hypothetical protein